MAELSELEKKILLNMFELEASKDMRFILKENIINAFPGFETDVEYFLEWMEDQGYIYSPARSFSFRFTKSGLDYCGKYFI
jgi:hypothetical protein